MTTNSTLFFYKLMGPAILSSSSLSTPAPRPSNEHLRMFIPGASAEFSSIALRVLVLIICIYLPLVHLLRFRRIEGLQNRFGRTPEQFGKMNYKDAQTILGGLFLLDSPWIFLTSKDFAFLRAFGIPSISEVSVRAKKMVDEPGLRYADTMVFATEWIMNPLDSERARLSLNRVNYIHAQYRNIKTDQMVYTLCLLVSEVFRWIDEYDWRTSTSLERHASYIFWKEVGIRMGIAEKTIPASFEDCAQFVEDYESREMGPSAANERIANGVIHMYNSMLPSFVRPLFTRILTSFMDTKLRSALGLESVNPIISRGVIYALRLRALFVRHCLLPRYNIPQVFSPNKDGSYSVTYWMMQPWYAPATVWNRWGPTALYCRAFGIPIPGKGWVEGGYRLESVGHKGKGAEKVLEVMERAREGGCPYSTFGMVKDESELGGIYSQYATSCPMSMAS